jgi:putative DNA primase/helicase
MSENTVNVIGMPGGDRAGGTADDLTLETKIQTEDGGIQTVRELVRGGLVENLQCRSPFSESDGRDAFVASDLEGLPFVQDRSTGITHSLNEAGKGELRLTRALAKIEEALPEVKADSAAALKDEVVESLAAIRHAKPSEYERQRAALKNANGKVPLGALDRAVKSREAEQNTAQTHHGYAKTLLEELTEGTSKPVGFHNELFVLDPKTQLWVSLPVDALVKHVAELHDGKDHCSRSSDYRAIAQHAVSLADDSKFFATAAIGIACPDGFYQLIDGAISRVPLTPQHRQRVMLPFTPTPQPIPLFYAFLHDTFASDAAGEEGQQITLVQEIAGAVMLGLMPKQQKAVLFQEPYGRAGKGTAERILRNLVPENFVTAVSPFRWSHDYHVATLAGKRLNVVGELPENEAIPASAFKSVIGGDLVTGRHPTHRPITFTNEAAHIFTSNHLILTKDQSEAFYARWLIVGFPNSRLRSGLPIDPGLAERIIASELPGIAYWALEGAKRLIANGDFSKSSTHDRLMAKWRCSSSSLNEFIHECCEVEADAQVRRSEFYVAYIEWCGESGRKRFAKGRVKELLENNIGMGVRLAEVNGYELFRGLRLKPTDAGRHELGRTAGGPVIPDYPDSAY